MRNVPIVKSGFAVGTRFSVTAVLRRAKLASPPFPMIATDETGKRKCHLWKKSEIRLGRSCLDRPAGTRS